ncbi:site-specific integrase, partial [uncultured Alistipes sp.]
AINRGVMAVASTIEEVLTRFELDNKRPPSVAEFKEAFDLAAGRAKPEEKKPEEKPLGFFAVYDLFTGEMGVTNNWTKSTYTKFSSLKAHLKNYNKKLTLEGFDKATFAGFVAHLQTKVRQLNTTVAKNVGFLRWFLRWAAANGYYTGLAHLQYRPRFKGLDCKEVIYLEWDELIHFLNFEFPANKPSLPAVRDVFCFCCFTGLRYSDVAKLRRSDIHREQTPPFMSIVTKKTTARLHIELNKYALALLDKYEGVGLPNDKALPVISNVKMNENLHEAAEVAGIDEPVNIVSYVGSERSEVVVPKYSVLTTHAGRRTFIVNALRLGIPAPVIMEWTGHSDFKAMKPYIKIVNDAKVENMERFNSFGSNRSTTDEGEK